MRETSNSGSGSNERDNMQALVELEAAALGVPRAVALAIAHLESSFNPRARGDLQWAAKKPALYKRLVVDNPYFASNPVRTDPAQWYSRGLFQLLACYHVRGNEHPDVLFDPRTNTRRGVLFIRSLLEKTKGDPLQARLYYTGAIAGTAELQADTKAKMREALTRFGWSGT